MSQTKPSFAGDGQLDLTASLPGGRGYPRLTALPNGDALACGDTIDGFSCERYDAQQESWVIMPMPPMLHNPHMATLSDGTLILVGGTENGEGKAKVWRRDAIDGEFRQLADLPQAIESRTVFVMQDDTVLVYDGSESDFFLLSPAADSFTRFINEAHRSYEPFLESQGLKLRDDRSGDSRNHGLVERFQRSSQK